MQVLPPYAHTPRDEDFYVRDPVRGGLKPNAELVKDHFIHEGRLTEEQALFILSETTELMRREPNMLVISGPVTGARHLTSVFALASSFMDVFFLLGFVFAE